MNLCLSFFQAVATLANPLPADIEATVRSRISYQYAEQNPSQKLAFDDPTCSQKGVYSYTATSIVLNAENEVWRGAYEISFNDLLDGKKLSFANVSPISKLYPKIADGTSDARYTAPKASSRVGAIVVSGAVIGAVVYAVMSASKKSPKSNPKRAEAQPSATSAKIRFSESTRYE